MDHTPVFLPALPLHALLRQVVPRTCTILSALFLLLQAPSALWPQQYHPAEWVPPAHLEPLIPSLEGAERVGHAFYPDLLRAPRAPLRLLLVMDYLTAPHLTAALFNPDRLPPGTGVLVTAPRNRPGDAIQIIEAVPGYTRRIPVVFLREGPVTQWSLTTRNRAVPFWLARTVATATSAPVDAAGLSAGHLGFGPGDDVLRTALEEGIPAARLLVASPHDLPVVIQELEEALERIAGEPRDTSRNYLMAPFSQALFLRERDIITLFVFIGVALLFYTLSHLRQVHRYWRALRRNLPAVLLSLVVLTASLMAANLTLRLALTIPQVVDNPFLPGAGKAALGSLVMGLMAILLQNRIRRITAIYSGTAVFLLLAGVIVAASRSIVLGTYFAISFFFCVIFSFSRSGLLKGAALILSLAPVAYVVFAVGSVADTPLITTILTPPLYREIVTAVLFLPALLMLFRLDSLTPRIPLLLFLTMFSVVAVAVVVASTVHLAGTPSATRITVESIFPADAAATLDEIPGDGVVHVRMAPGSREPAPPVDVVLPSGITVSCPSPPCSTFVSPAPPPPATIATTVAPTLDRHAVYWELTLDRHVENATVRFETDQPVQLYASDLPTVQPLGSRGTRFSLATGPYPPRRLVGTLVFRTEARPVRLVATVTAPYTTPVPEIRPEPEELVFREVWTLRSRGLLE